MIGFLSGTIQEKLNNAIILSVQGVGYIVFLAQDHLHKSLINDSCNVFVYTIVREQEISLYGFHSLHERSLFEQLISVSGIGPRIAMEFFSFPVDIIAQAISQEDTAFLSQVKGVGKKTAEKIVLELKNKVSILHLQDTSSNTDSDKKSNATPSYIQDALLALEGLGYNTIDIIQKLKKAPQHNSAEELVTWFLQNHHH
jgi:holliday junction DNA helicase RuvA